MGRPATAASARLVHVPCNLCGGADARRLFEKDGLPIVACRACGLVYVNPRPGTETLEGLYDAEYWAAGGYRESEAGVRAFARDQLRRLAAHARPGRLLEVGAAWGFFLDEARAAGWAVAGVEVSAVAATHAREILGLEVRIGNAERADLMALGGPFDWIAMYAVIEHLEDPRAMLQRIAAALRPGGILTLSTGVYGSPNQRLLGPRWTIFAPWGHLYYFSKATLSALLAGVGLQIEALWTNACLYGPRTGHWLFDRWTGSRAYQRWLRIGPLVARKGWGDEMFVIARSAGAGAQRGAYAAGR